MVTATILGIYFVPVFFVIVYRLAKKNTPELAHPAGAAQAEAAVNTDSDTTNEVK